MLEYFWKLVSTEPGERRKAEFDLLKGLLASQSGAANGELHQDVDYAVKRLVRGLSSATEAARQGFASCLSELLHCLPQIELSLVIDLMHKSTEITGSIRGQEARDLLFGRIFTCLAVARSQRLEASEEDEDVKKAGLELFDTVLDIFNSKKVLRSMAAEALVSIMKQMPPDVFTAELASKLGAALGGAESSMREVNPEQLFVALAIQAYLAQHGLKRSDQLKGHLPDWVLSKSILKPSRVGKLVEVLKASSSAFPQVHPVWSLIQKELTGKEEGEEEAGWLRALWSTVVDQALATGTQERKALSLLLLQRFTVGLPSSSLSVVLSPQVLRVLIGALSTAGSANQLLAPLAKQTLEILVNNVKDDPAKRLVVASTLMSRGDVNFDKKTRTTTVEGLLAGLDSASMLQYIRRLAAAVSSGEQKEKGGEDDGEAPAAHSYEEELTCRVWAVDALYALSKHPTVVGDASMTATVLRLLLSLAYFDTTGFSSASASKKPKKQSKKQKKGGEEAAGGEGGSAASWVLVTTEVPQEVRNVAVARFQSLVADLSRPQRQEGEESGAGRAGASLVEGMESLWLVHEAWQGLEAHGAVLAQPLGEQARESRSKMLEAYAAIHEQLGGKGGGKADEGRARMMAALASLMLLVGVAQLGQEEAAEDEEEDMLGDVCRCVGELLEGKMGGDVDPMAVLADVCVSLLAASGDGATVRGLRDVIRKAWGGACGSCPLTKEALAVLLDVVCPGRATENGEAAEEEDEEQMEQEDEEGSDDDEDDESEGMEEDKDEEAASPSPRKKKGKGGEEESDSSDDEEDDEDEVIDADELLDVLGGSKDPEGAANAFEAMMALKKEARQGAKNDRIERERAKLQHRLRVLDLLEIVVAKQPQSPLLLDVLLPCLDAARRLMASAEASKPSEHKALARRLSDFMSKKLLVKARPKVSCSGELEAVAEAVLADLHRAPTAAQVSLLASVLSFVTRTALANNQQGAAGGSVPDWLAKVYRQSLEQFMTKRSALTAAPFDQLITRFSGPACLVLLPELIGYMSKASKSFLQAEAFRLSGMIVNRRRGLQPTEARDLVYREIPRILDAAATVLLSTEGTGEGGGGLKAKRVKPIMDCCQEAANALGDKEVTKGVKANASKSAARVVEGLEKVKASTPSEPIKKACAALAKKLGQGAEGASSTGGDVASGKKRKAGKEQASSQGKGGEQEEAPSNGEAKKKPRKEKGAGDSTDEAKRARRKKPVAANGHEAA